MKQAISYDSILSTLVSAIPQLAPAYDKQMASYAPETVPPYVFVEDEFVP